MSKAAPIPKSERLRRLAYGYLRKLFRHRYGATLPETGADDLELLLYPLSLGDDAPSRMRNAIEIYAPWAEPDAGGLIARILHMPPFERKLKPAELGRRTGCTNAERERLRLWLIAPVDMTADALADQRRAKKRERDRQRRLKSGAVPRHLSKTALKPWEAEGMTRRTWYRKQRGTNTRSTNSIRLTRTCATDDKLFKRPRPAGKSVMVSPRR